MSSSTHSEIYETCKWSNQTLTDRFIKSSEEFLNADTKQSFSCPAFTYTQYNGLQTVTDVINTVEPFSIGPVPPVCFLSVSARATINNKPKKPLSKKQKEECPKPPKKREKGIKCPVIKYYYCNSPEDINPRDTMPVKNPETGETKHLWLRGPCINREYHDLLVKTFNKMADCFDLSEREIRNLFAIINHESGFIPNARSHTGVRCAGQLSKPTIVTLNAQILGKNVIVPARYVHKSATEKCPSLLNKTIPPDIRCEKTQNCPHETLKKEEQKDRQNKLNKYPVTCKLTSDLPQCFFYTFLNFKTLIMNFDDNFQESNEFEDQEPPEQFSEKYGFGLNINEILIAKSDSDEDYLFINTRSAYKEFQKYEIGPDNPMYNRNVQIVSVISEEDKEKFKFFVTQLSYNGGSSIAKPHVKNFLSFLKEQIDRAECPSSRDRKYCEYRAKILQGQSLDLNSIQEDFTSYLRSVEYYSSKQKMWFKQYPRDEMYEYPSKIKNRIDNFQNTGKNRSNLEKLALKHLEDGKASAELKQQARNTAEDIKNQCHIPIL